MADTTLSFNVLAKDNASKTFDKVGRSADGAGKKFGFLAARSHGLTAGMTAGFGKIVAGLGVIAGVQAFKGFIDEARESERVGRITENAIKATGGAAKITADQVGTLAEKLSNKTAVDDEVIQSGANLLLTFKNVRNEVGEGANVFDRATAAAVDLSAAGFGDVNGASKMLGKALNDPLKGLTALGKAGVTFTEDQKKQIKTLTETGDVLGAQKIILKEVEGQVGGAAAAAADPMQRLSVIAGNLKERIGVALLPVVGAVANILAKVLPAALDKASIGVGALVGAFKEGDVTSDGFVGVMERVGVVARKTFDFFKFTVIPVLSKTADFIGKNRDFFVPFIGILLGVAAAVKVWTIAQAALNFVLTANPIGLVIVAVAALVGGLIYAYKNSEKFRNIINAVGSALKGGFLAAVNGVKTAFKAIVDTGSTVIDFFKNLPGTVIGAVKNAGKWLYDKGRAMVFGLMNGILAITKGFANWFMRAPATHVFAPFAHAGIWLIKHGKELITGFMKGVIAVLRAAGSAGGWLYRNVIKPFAVTPWVNAGTWLVSRGRSVLNGLLSGAVSVLRSIGGAAGWVYKNVIKPFVVTPWAQAGTWLVSKGSAVLNGLLSGVVNVLRAVKGVGVWMYNNVIKPIVTGFGKAGTWLVASGKNLVYGLMAGIVDRMKGIGGWVKGNVVDPVVNAVKKFFGIKSPSKVFEAIGKYMIAGLLKGLSTGNGATIAKKVFGSMPKALAGLVSKGIVGIGQLPGKALDALQSIGGFLSPGDITIPANLLKRTIYQGETMDFSTLKAMQRAESMIGGAFNVMQGSYSTRVGASAGTHRGGGAIDLDKDGTTWGRAVAALRASGFAAWHRTPAQGPWGHHIHAIQIGNPNLSPEAKGQVKSYLGGGTGLAGYRQGTPWVPNDQIARIHKGEGVVPEDINRKRLDLTIGAGQRPIVIDARGSRGFDKMAATWLLELIRTNPAVAGQLKVLLR